MANGWSPFIGMLFIFAFCGGVYRFAPRGENQVVWRWTLMQAAWACYLMWVFTFLAQYNPLIEPRHSKLRPEYVHESL